MADQQYQPITSINLNSVAGYLKDELIQKHTADPQLMAGTLFVLRHLVRKGLSYSVTPIKSAIMVSQQSFHVLSNLPSRNTQTWNDLRREFAQLVADHIFGDGNVLVRSAVVHHEIHTNKVGQNSSRARLRLDDLLLVAGLDGLDGEAATEFCVGKCANGEERRRRRRQVCGERVTYGTM